MTAKSAAFEAVRRGDLAALLGLLEDDPALARARDEQGVSLLLAALYHRRGEMVEAILPGAGDLDLFEAAATGRTPRVEALLAAGPKLLGHRSPDGFTALHLACFFGQKETVRHLIHAGADVDAAASNASRVAPLHSAVAGGEPLVVDLLLAAGAARNPCQAGGYTPLMGAAANGREDMVRSLLAAGADPAIESDDGKTARDLALERGQERSATMLPAP